MKPPSFVSIVRKNTGLVKAGKIVSVSLAPFVGKKVKITVERVD